MSPIVFPLAVVTAASAWICYLIAKKRKASVQFWIGMGIFFGPLAIPFVFFSRPEAQFPNSSD
jgi:hypothetical protein